MSILGDIGTRSTPQSEPVRGKAQVANNAGGYVFGLDDWARLARFLVLGVDASTYYVGRRELALDNAACVRRCLDADPVRAVDLAVDISTDGRAPSNDPAIYVFAVAAATPGPARDRAFARLGDVCRTGTHLFHFARFVEGHRGWGRGLRRAVAGWYERDNLDLLAYQVVKYRQRDGWTHRDLLRLAHPTAPTDGHRAVYDFVCGRHVEGLPPVVDGFLKMAEASDPDEAAALVREYRLPWETVPSHLLDARVWDALLDSGALPLGAMVRNLGVMTARGVLGPQSHGTGKVLDALGDVDAIRKARLHPVAILNALITYGQGRGFRGDLTWAPVTRIVDALDAAFYASFETVEPAGKRTVLALDVSGSMSYAALPNAAFNAAAGATAMAMVTAATEPQVTTMAFSGGFVPVDVSPRRRLDDNLRALAGMPFDRTDCAAPMLWATANNVQADTFVIYTDNETWAGQIHPFQALRQYRERTGIDARLVVVGMTSTGFTIADPSDPGMLDVVGFDTSAPQVMSAFSAGRF